MSLTTPRKVSQPAGTGTRGTPATSLPWEPSEIHVAGAQHEICSHETPAQPIQLKKPKASPTHTSKPDEGDTLARKAPDHTKPASSCPHLVGDTPEPPGTRATSTRCAGAVRWMWGGGGTPQQTVFPCLSSKYTFQLSTYRSSRVKAPGVWRGFLASLGIMAKISLRLL